MTKLFISIVTMFYFSVFTIEASFVFEQSQEHLEKKRRLNSSLNSQNILPNFNFNFTKLLSDTEQNNLEQTVNNENIENSMNDFFDDFIIEETETLLENSPILNNNLKFAKVQLNHNNSNHIFIMASIEQLIGVWKKSMDSASLFFQAFWASFTKVGRGCVILYLLKNQNYDLVKSLLADRYNCGVKGTWTRLLNDFLRIVIERCINDNDLEGLKAIVDQWKSYEHVSEFLGSKISIAPEGDVKKYLKEVGSIFFS